MRANPIYPGEWHHQFKSGDRVLVLSTRKIGTVVKITGDGSKLGIAIRLDGNNRNGTSFYYPEELRLATNEEMLGSVQFNNNPIYPSEWSEFREWHEGDPVKVIKETSKFKGRRGQIIKIGVSSAGYKLFLVRFSPRTKALFKKEDLENMIPNHGWGFSENPIYPESWGTSRSEDDKVVPLFDVGSRVKYRGPSLSFLPHGSLGTVHSHTMNRDDSSPPRHYLTYNIRFDRQPEQVYWFLASELASGYQDNPVYPAEWSNSKFKIGDTIRTKPKGYAATQGPALYGKVTGYGEKPGTVWVKFKFNKKDVLKNESDIFPTGSQFNNNPIYPEEWPSIQAGDIVEHITTGEKGVVLGINVPYGGFKWLRIRWHFNAFSNTGGESLIAPSSVKRIGTYNENPVYPTEWKPEKPRYSIGDCLRRKNSNRKFKIVHHEVINGEDYFTLHGDIKNENLRHMNEYTLDKYFDKIAPPQFQNNPIYPEEWSGTPKYKVGDIVIGKSGTYIDVIGKIDRVPGDMYMGRIYYHIDFGGGLTDNLFEHVIRLANSNERKTYRRAVSGGRYRRNPVYDKDWYPQKIFHVGDKVQVLAVDSGYHRQRGIVKSHIYDELKRDTLYLVALGATGKSTAYFSGNELIKTVFNPNPIYPPEWGDFNGQHPYAVGECVEIADGDGSITADNEYYSFMLPLIGKRGIVRRIFKITNAGLDRYRYDVMLDGEVEASNFKHSHLKKVSYNTNPVYPEEWTNIPKVKIGDRVVIADGSTWAVARVRIGTITHIEDLGSDKEFAFVTLDHSGRSVTRYTKDIRSATKEDEVLGRW